MNGFSKKPDQPVIGYCFVKMVWLTGFLIWVTGTAVAQDTEQKIDIRLDNEPLKAVFNFIEKNTNARINYSEEEINTSTRVTIKLHQATVQQIILAALKKTSYEFVKTNNTYIIKRKSAAAPDKKVAAAGSLRGRIAGTIRNDKNETMQGVTIQAEPSGKATLTAVNGEYVLVLPAGIYTVTISSIGYQPRRIADVVVKGDDVTDLNAVLSTGSKQLQEVVVTGGARKESVRALLLAQKNSAGMTNGISAEQIRATPDNNTAQVLKRVSGIIVQGEKFVTIRGVSDRYNNVLINGASLPSTEPNKRNFSFDIVPSALVDNIVVNKTATPDLPGEFTGGIVQINTIDVPFRNFMNITAGLGYNSESTGRAFISHKRDEKAALGIIDNNRKWFGEGRVFDQQQYVQYHGNHDTAAMRAIGAQIPNRWKTYQYPYSPMKTFQVSGGAGKILKNNSSIGAVAAVTYRNEMLYEEGAARSLQNYDYASRRYLYNTTIGGVLNTAFKSKNHKLAWKNIYNNKYSVQYDDRYGYQISNSRFENRTAEVTLANRLIQTRLEGEHSLLKGGFKIDWFGDFSQLNREQPDGRFLVGTELSDSGRHIYSYQFGEPNLFWGGLYASTLKEKRTNAGANLYVPFTVAKAKQSFKAGYAYSKRTADFNATGLRARTGSKAFINSVAGLPYYKIATPEAISSGVLVYTPIYPSNYSTGDRYDGKQHLYAAYGMLDLKMFKKLRLVGGLRYEDNRVNMSTITYDNLGLPVLSDSVYNDKDWLPSVNAIYSVTDKLNIRAAFSKTLARPDFVERSPYLYFDFPEQLMVTGQKALSSTRVKNYDFRVEYYPSGNEIFSASIFYKYFDKPVERFYILGSPNNRVEYWNLHSATAKGVEAEIRKSLAFIMPSSQWLQNLYITANATYLEGGIKFVVTKSPVTGHDTIPYIDKSSRPIQGLSPYIINGGLNYQGKIYGFNIAYNRFGRRIVNGGTVARIIQYENPRDIVDLQLSMQVLKQKGEIRLNISDLLNQYTVIYSNNMNHQDNSPYPVQEDNNDPKGAAYNKDLDFETYKVKKGTGFSISLTYKL